MTIAVYPGSFDPVTNGHLDIATRAGSIFDELIIAVYDAPPKRLLFDTKERVDLFRDAARHLPNVRVMAYAGLTVDVAHQVGARVIVRGLRSGSDFESEFDMALMNKSLDPNIEMLYFMASADQLSVRSSLLKEVAELGGSIDHMVPVNVAKALYRKFSRVPSSP